MTIKIGREVRLLAEKFEDTVFKVLSAKDVGLGVGVGTPFIVRDPDTYQPYMFFTGWDDPGGTERRVFVVPIDDATLEVDVSKVREVVSPATFGVSGLATVHAMWDDYNEQWVLLMSVYPTSNEAAVAFLDKNFNLVGTQRLAFTKADGTALDVGDNGVSIIPLHNKYALLTTGGDSNRTLHYVSNVTARPIPAPTLLSKYSTITLPLAPTYYSWLIDVHHSFMVNGRFVMLSELMQYSRVWRIQVYYGAERDLMVGTTLVPFMTVTPIIDPFPLNFTDVIGNVGHPHFTQYLKQPYLFFARFPTWNLGGKRAWSHDIWAMRIDPDQVFNPVKNFPLVTSSFKEPYTAPSKLPIPTFGAKRAIIYLFGVAATGTLTVYESTSPYHIYSATTIRYSTSYSIAAGANKIVIDNPAPWIGLETNVDLSEWMVVLQQ
jgi:hypothetical protein